MAKVGKENYSNGKNFATEKPIEFLVYFSQKEGFYCIPPAGIIENLDTKKVSGKDYNDAVNNMNKCIDDYFQKGFVKRKIILYIFEYCCMEGQGFTDRSNWGGYSNMPFHGSDRWDAKQIISIDYKVCYLLTIGDKEYISMNNVTNISDLQNSRITKYHWSSNGGYSHHEWMNWKYIEWTELAENWFKDTIKKLTKLIRGCADFFGEDNSLLLTNITTGKNLLEYKPTKK